MLKYCTYFFDERVVIGSYTNKTLTENDWRVVDKTIRCWARYRFEKNWAHIHGADLKVRYL